MRRCWKGEKINSLCRSVNQITFEYFPKSFYMNNKLDALKADNNEI